MKFVKLLRPLFFVALGLHGLALFLPFGKASETVEVETVEEAAVDENLTATSPGELPVPDLNALAENSAIAPVPASSTTNVLSPAAVRQTTPVAQPSAATRSAPMAAAVPNAGAARNTTVGVPTESSSTMPSAPTENASSSPPLDLSALETDEPLDNADPSEGDAKTPMDEASPASSEGEFKDRLIASVLIKVPDSLRALMNQWAIALKYNPKGTDDSSAETATEKWADKINSQASRNGVGRLEPELVKDFARLNYPIESSVKDSEQSFRVCLEQPPGSAEVGVLFDSQGNLVGEPELVRSTGYKAVNSEVVALVESERSLPDNRLSKAFVLEIPVDYDEQACVQLSDVKR